MPNVCAGGSPRPTRRVVAGEAGRVMERSLSKLIRPTEPGRAQRSVVDSCAWSGHAAHGVGLVGDLEVARGDGG
jgi:hypothetical protein